MSTDLRRSSALKRLDAGMAAAALIALASLVAEHGFRVGPRWIEVLRVVELACVLAFGALQAAKLLVVSGSREYLRTHRLDFSLLFLMAVQTAVHVGLRDTPEFRWLEAHGAASPLWAFYIGVLQAYLVGIVVLRSPLLHRLLVRLRLRPAQIMVASFLVLIGMGTLLLALPGSARDGRLAPVDALFTATSAVCVTGLVVRDTGTELSAMGHTVLVGLIQAGGLGMLTITASFALFGGAGLGGGEAASLGRALDLEETGQMRRVLGRVIRTTFLMEGIGAVALYWAWSGTIQDPFRRAAWSAFHSVSAFCNAGFSLFPGNASLTGFAGDLPTNLVIGTLIVAGGLGYGVLHELADWVLARVLRRSPSPLSRHARWVLGGTLFLVAAGAVLLEGLERHGALAHLGAADRFLAAAFQSVTLRTAGFNTVDLAALGMPAVVVCVSWMLIGGSPGSAAGGMKTTTAMAVLAGWIRPRTLQPAQARRARLLAVLFVGAFAVSWILVGLVQGQWGRKLAFEVASALGTVGLSMGYTGELGAVSRVILCAVMFAGRVGPFALAASLLPLADRREAAGEDRGVLLG